MTRLQDEAKRWVGPSHLTKAAAIQSLRDFSSSVRFAMACDERAHQPSCRWHFALKDAHEAWQKAIDIAEQKTLTDAHEYVSSDEFATLTDAVDYLELPGNSVCPLKVGSSRCPPKTKTF